MMPAGSYDVQETTAARAQLEALPVLVARRIRSKAGELAELAAVAPVSSSMRASRFPAASHFMVEGLRVTYAIDALRQRLTIQSVARQASKAGSA